MKQVLSLLTLEEKAALVSGRKFMYTNPVTRVGIPSVAMSDGPHGLRKQPDDGAPGGGLLASIPSTAFPTASCTASGWNEENLVKMGQAIAEECRYLGVNLLLGPGINVKRNPLCGRNFEYFSEDPLLAGKMCGALVRGLQGGGVGAVVKHFALNNAENYRITGSSMCDERTARDIYLKAFEIAIKECEPVALMCAYNKINGEYCSENKWLLTDVLRGDWGFKGAVMSDWGTTHDRVKGIKSGLDLEMPGDTPICRRWIVDAVRDGSLSMQELDTCVERVLSLTRYTETPRLNEASFKDHHRLAAEIAEDCAVLLRNDGALPLEKDAKICVLGDLFVKMRYQGSGSSLICPTEVTTAEQAFKAHGVDFVFARGYNEASLEADASLLQEALEVAADYSSVVLFMGLTDLIESEGMDRESMALPENQLALVRALVDAGKRITVVLHGGSPVELPFADDVSAILNMYLAGQNGGEAAYNLLFGNKCPCGRLAESWPLNLSCVPFSESYSKSRNELYKEAVFVGYRHFIDKKEDVRYPFGYGLSYTRFEYCDMSVEQRDGIVTVNCTVKNVGDCFGAETVQVYSSPINPFVFAPTAQLRGFKKVYLTPGQEARVTVSFSEADLSYYNVKTHRAEAEGEEYFINVCSDSFTVKLSQRLKLSGVNGPHESPYPQAVNEVYSSRRLDLVTDGLFEQFVGVPIAEEGGDDVVTLESRFVEIRRTALGRLVHYAVMSVPRREERRAMKLPEGEARSNALKSAWVIRHVFDTNSFINMSMSAGKMFPYNVAQGMVYIANGKPIKGLFRILKKIKAPKLPG